MSRSRAVGVVLAAGAGARFGSVKQLAEIGGRPLITWPVRAMLDAGVEGVVVVLGAHAPEIAPVVRGHEEVDVVVASDWETGMSASLRAGVASAAERGADRVVVVLGDQPLLDPAAIRRVCDAEITADIARATYDGVPGHPVVLARSTFAAVAELTGDVGARALRGFVTLDVPCDGLGSPLDIDTPDDLARAAAFHGSKWSSQSHFQP